MKEDLKNALTGMYNLFSTLNDRVYFKNSKNTNSHLFTENGKLMVAGGGIDKHAIDINDQKDISILACAFYTIFA